MFGRGIGRSCKIAVALSTMLCSVLVHATAQTAYTKRIPKQPSGSWMDCFQRASPSDVAALAEEMERHALETDDRSSDFTSAYLAATNIAIFSPEAKANPELLRARYERARRVADQYAGDDYIAPECNYATALRDQFRFEQMIDVLQPIVDLHPGAIEIRPHCLVLLSDAFYQLHRYDDAERYAREAETQVERSIEVLGAKNPGSDLLRIVKLNAIMTRFRAYESLGSLEQAGALLQEMRTAMEAAEAAFPDNNSRYFYLNCVIAFDASTGNAEHQLATADEILRLDPPPDRISVIEATVYRAMAQAQIAEFTGAEDGFDEPEEALKNAIVDPELGPTGRIDALRILCWINFVRGTHDELRVWMDELRNLPGLGSEQIRLNSSILATMEASVALHSNVSSSELARTRDEHARAFADFLRVSSTLPLRPEGVSFLVRWNQIEIVVTQAFLELAVDPSEEGRERAFAVILRAQQLGTFGRTVGAPAASLRELRDELLSSDTGLIAYLPGETRSCVAIVDRGGVQIVELARHRDLMATVRAFQSECMRPPESDSTPAAAEERTQRWRSTGSAVREKLFPPDVMAAVERWKGFYVCGMDSLLESPPLEGLPWIRGQALGVEKAIGYLPSVHVGVWLARRERGARSSSDPSLVVVAAPRQSTHLGDTADNLPPLEISDAALDKVTTPFPDGDSRRFTGENATVENLCGACSRSVDVLELFAHGVHDFARARPSGIALTPSGSNDGRIWCEEIESGIQSPPLVALFACGSAISSIRKGDDTAAQLGNSFLRSGAETVLLCRTDVAYGAMLELAAAFNAALARDHVSPAEALRRARGELARSERWKDPFFYAHVSAVGLALAPWHSQLATASPKAAESSAPQTSRSESLRGPVSVAGAVLLLAAGVVLARRRRAA
jgi:tetratricopeptide (TPR) repeat protein